MHAYTSTNSVINSIAFLRSIVTIAHPYNSPNSVQWTDWGSCCIELYILLWDIIELLCCDNTKEVVYVPRTTLAEMKIDILLLSVSV